MTRAPESGPQRAPGGEPPRIPGYRIVGVLGRGAAGVVYRAVQLSIDREVALKVLHAGSVSSPRAVQRLQREARTAARLRHPNIISSIDMGTSGGTWWFAMELVDGVSLAERLDKGGRLTEREALRLFLPLCDALQHAAEHGVVHRDVKPANILLEAGGRPRLVDLGLARVEDDPGLTRTGATLGTPHYVSPEQARDPGAADSRSDVWSLGATIFHAVTGRPPFEGESTAEILSNVLYARIPDPRSLRPEMSRGLALVLRKCLSRDPSKRYYRPGELAADLELVRARKAPAIRPGSLEPVERGAELRAGWRVALGLALVAAVALLAVFRPWRGDPERAPDAGAPDEAWGPAARVERGLESGEWKLADAAAALDELAADAPDERAAEVARLRGRVTAELERVLYELQQEVDRRLEELLAAHDFDAAGALLSGELDARVSSATGYDRAALPGRWRTALERRVERDRRRVDAARAAAVSALVAGLDGYRAEVLWPRIERAERSGRWDEALAALERGPAAWSEPAGVDARGLGEADLRDALAPLRLAWERRGQELANRWWEVDEALRERALALAAEHEARLRERTSLHVAADYAEAFQRELDRRGLARDHVPERFTSRALDAFERRREELLALEDELLEAEADGRLAALEERCAPLWAGRDYAAAAAFWRGMLDDPALEPVLDAVELRLEEARELVAFLARVERGLRAREGQRASVRIAGIAYEGRLDLRGDPLEQGFELAAPNGTTHRVLVRPRAEGTPAGARVLGVEGLESLAATDGTSGPDRDLQSALLRYREGDLEGAREILAAGTLSEDDLIVHDLRERVERGLGRAADERTRRRAYAARIYEQLDRRGVGEGSPRAAARRIDGLLKEYGDVLEAAESARLRSLRKQYLRGYEPSTEEEFERIFGPDDLAFLGLDRVTLSFRFDDGAVGAWQAGDWYFDGELGWRSPGTIERVDQLPAARVPTLHLRDPFAIDGGVVVVRASVLQPQDAPAELLVLSACGFHAAFDGGGVGMSPHCLVDTTSLADVIARVRGGEGRPFAGLARGERHELRLRLNPARGTVYVDVDDERVADFERLPPSGPRSESLSIRSLEPVRLLAVEVEGGRR